MNQHYYCFTLLSTYKNVKAFSFSPIKKPTTDEKRVTEFKRTYGGLAERIWREERGELNIQKSIIISKTKYYNF